MHMNFIIYKYFSQTFFHYCVSLWDDTQGSKFTFMHKLQSIHGKYGTAKLSLKQAQREVKPYLDCCCSLGYASHEILTDTHLTAFQSFLIAFFAYEQGNKSKLIPKTVGVSRKLSEWERATLLGVKERSNSQSFCLGKQSLL